MYTSKHMKPRIAFVQKLDEIFYEPGNASRCHKWVFEHIAYHFVGGNYDTYLNHIDREKHNYPEIVVPKEIVAMLRELKRLDTERRNARKQKSSAKRRKAMPKPTTTADTVMTKEPEKEPEKEPQGQL